MTAPQSFDPQGSPDRAKKIILAAPRGWCAGVERAVEIVERALLVHGAPVYVRKQIVHNLHVVRELEGKGAVFVDSEEAIPPGRVCVLSAHGVSPQVRSNAHRRGLKVIDATCPLVAKVHVEARRLASAGKTVFLIGHSNHEEVEGTAGEAPGQTLVIEDIAGLRAANPADPDAVAYITQTTLSVDDTAGLVEALQRRFPAIEGPKKDDICYASQNRQRAIKSLARLSDVVLVVGAQNSSNANRMVEVARQASVPSWLVTDETHIDDSWIDGAAVVGVSAAASTPEVLVERVVAFLRDRGYSQVEEIRVASENVHFPLPPGLETTEAG